MIFRSPYPDIAIPEVPLYQFVSKGFAARSDKAAITDGPSGRALTYGQLANGVRRMAVGLAHRGFGKGDLSVVIWQFWIDNIDVTTCGTPTPCAFDFNYSPQSGFISFNPVGCSDPGGFCQRPPCVY